MKRNLIYHTNVSTDMQVIASRGEAIQISCHLDSVSKDGATLTCDRKTLDTLLPNSLQIAPKTPAEINLDLSLQGNGKLDCSCNVIYARRISRDTYLLETRFKNLNTEQTELIDQFVENNLNRSIPSARESHLQAVA